MNRRGYLEECYYNFTFSPVRGESGTIDGIFNAVVETTDRVLSERRLLTMSRMGERADPTLQHRGRLPTGGKHPQRQRRRRAIRACLSARWYHGASRRLRVDRSRFSRRADGNRA